MTSDQLPAAVLAIDPGTERSAVVMYRPAEQRFQWAEWMLNPDVLTMMRRYGREAGGLHVAIEDIQSFGLEVGRSTFETCVWIGRFAEAFEGAAPGRNQPATMVSRRDVKIVLCGRMTYKDPRTGNQKKVGDSEVRRAVLGRFPATGGGSTPQVGTKKQPGPCYCLRGDQGHKYQAAAIAVTYIETR